MPSEAGHRRKFTLSDALRRSRGASLQENRKPSLQKEIVSVSGSGVVLVLIYADFYF